MLDLECCLHARRALNDSKNAGSSDLDMIEAAMGVRKAWGSLSVCGAATSTASVQQVTPSHELNYLRRLGRASFPVGEMAGR